MGRWGDRLERLPLDDAERRLLQDDLYELFLLRVQARLSREPVDAPELLVLLDRAAALAEPSRSYHRLRARVFRRLREETQAAKADRLADDPASRCIALDHFLVGETYRTQLATMPSVASDGAGREAKPALLANAMRAYHEALEIDPHHYWSHLQLGRCYLSLGRKAEAVEALTTCIALKPEAPWGYSTRGLVWALLGRFDEAERDLQRAINRHPDFLPARLNYAVTLWIQGKKKYGEALAQFQAVWRASPPERPLFEAVFYRGQIYLALGQSDQALQEFDQVVTANPQFRPVYAIRAKSRFLLGNDEAGLEDLTTLVRLEAGPACDPKSSEAHALRGRYLLRLGSELPVALPQSVREAAQRRVLDLALLQLQKAVELGGRSAALFDDLGVACERCGRVADAIQAYSQGLELAPDQIKLRVKRGWAYILAAQDRKGQADFAWALRHDPTHPWARAGLGYAHARLNAPGGAEVESLYALLHGADDYLVLHNLACIQVRLSLLPADQAASRQELAIALLHRAIECARQQNAADDEVEQIRRESDFEPLRSRPDFQRLVADVASEE
jgi:tetratricopeptide (TPR) repeat protein